MRSEGIPATAPTCMVLVVLTVRTRNKIRKTFVIEHVLKHLKRVGLCFIVNRSFVISMMVVMMVNCVLVCLRNNISPKLRMRFGERAFSDTGAATWIALPDNIRTVRADPVRCRKPLK